MILEPVIVVTNNPLSKQEFEKKHSICFVEGNTMEVFKIVRDYVHRGHKLITHPLMSSIKPNQTPYRTVIITEKNEMELDFNSLDYIEGAIQSTEKFIKNFGIPNWSENVLEDFKLIDFSTVSEN